MSDSRPDATTGGEATSRAGEVSGDGLVGRIPGGVLVVCGVAILLEARTFEVAFLTDPVGPKALPLLVGAVMTLAGLAAVRRPEVGAGWPTRATALRLAAATAAFIAYSLLLPVLGFFTSTTLAVAGLSWLFGAELRRAVPAAVLLSTALWLLFVRLLALPLPIGDLWLR